MNKKIKILWAYPDILNLHGDRGNLMALERIGGLLGLAVEIVRVDDPGQPLALADADLLFLCPGEVKNMPQLVDIIDRQKEQLTDFLKGGGYLFAIGSTGAVFARETMLVDGSSFAGLSLLPMRCRQRESVYGDDIWFSPLFEPETKIIGNQIQINLSNKFFR